MDKNGWIGKRISVYYDDNDKVSRRDGVCSNNSETEIELDYRLIFQKSRVIRIEIQRDHNKDKGWQ